MSSVVTLHADKRWKAIIDYSTDEGSTSVEHYFEEISDLSHHRARPKLEFPDPLHHHIEPPRRRRGTEQRREGASAGPPALMP